MRWFIDFTNGCIICVANITHRLLVDVWLSYINPLFNFRVSLLYATLKYNHAHISSSNVTSGLS